MKDIRYGLPLVAWTAIGLGLQGPGLWAGNPNESGVVEIGGLRSRVPSGWAEEVPNSRLFLKQYRLEPVNDDKDPARVTVLFLGKESGASAAEYVKGWKAVFLPPEGRTMNDAAKVRQLTVRGAAVTYLDVRGDYKGTPGNDATPRQDYRLLAVYFDTPQGPFVIRLFGPADTVGFYRNGFENWVKAFK